MVFQNYSLFPHMTVGENIAFGLKMARTDAGEIRRRVGEMLDLVHSFIVSVELAIATAVVGGLMGVPAALSA